MYSPETLRCMGAHRQYFVTTTKKGSKFTKIRAFSFVSTRPRCVLPDGQANPTPARLCRRAFCARQKHTSPNPGIYISR